MKLTLPTNSKERKDYPMATGCDEYFPAALAGVARHSFLAGARHTPGEPMHHKRGASMDHTDCIRRHMTDMADMLAWLAREPEVPTGDVVAALMAEADALAWRALAYSQQLHETHGGAPLAPAARVSLGCGAIDPNGGAVCVLMTGHEGAHMSGEQVERTVGMAPPIDSGPTATCGLPGCALREGHGGPHSVDEPGMTRLRRPTGREGFEPGAIEQADPAQFDPTD